MIPDEAYRQEAREQTKRTGAFTVDANAEVRRAPNGDAWVATWVYIEADEAFACDIALRLRANRAST